MIITHCTVHTTPDGVDAFVAATRTNAEASRQEPGIQLFECIQSIDDPTEFCLVEHYDGPEDVEAHKTTAHYLAWREAVADLMAVPRQSTKYQPLS